MKTIIVMLGAVMVVQSVCADTKRDTAIKFLKAHVIGKSVSDSTSATNKDVPKPYDYEMTWRSSFMNLEETQKGFKFQEAGSIKHTRFDLGSDGKRTGAKRNMDRSYSFSWELTFKPTADRIIGILRSINSSFDDPNGLNDELTVLDVQPNKLAVEAKTIGIYEWPRAMSSEIDVHRQRTTRTFLVDESGKLRVHHESEYSILDPKTLTETTHVVEKPQEQKEE